MVEVFFISLKIVEKSSLLFAKPEVSVFDRVRHRFLIKQKSSSKIMSSKELGTYTQMLNSIFVNQRKNIVVLFGWSIILPIYALAQISSRYVIFLQGKRDNVAFLESLSEIKYHIKPDEDIRCSAFDNTFSSIMFEN